MLPHVVADALRRPEEPGMAQVIDLVRADRAVTRVAGEPVDHRGGAAHEGDARARERDLRGRGEDERSIRVARLRREAQDVDGLRVRLAQVVEGVRVVPQDGEVRGSGLKLHELAGPLDAHAQARGVRVHRHDPDALDRGVRAGELRDLRDVRALPVHAHGDELEAQGCGELEVAIVAGDRAQHADGLADPRPRGARAAVEHCEAQRIPHERERGRALRQQLSGRHAQERGEDLPQLQQAGEPSVVAGVRAVRGAHVPGAHGRQQGIREVELCGRRLPARDVEVQTAGGEGLVVGPRPLEAVGDLLGCERTERHAGLFRPGGVR